MKEEFEETFVVAPAPEDVWKALTDRTVGSGASEDLHYVLPAFPSFTPLDVPGASCTPIEERPLRLLRVTKDREPCAGTEIAVTLEPAGTGTRVTVVQSGFDPWFCEARDAIITHGRQIMADFRLYLERGVTVPGTVWGPDLGALTRHTPVGLEIVSVEPAGFAESAGMRPGDVLLSLRGIRVHNTEQLWTVLALTDPGDSADVTWVRGRDPMQGRAALARLRSESSDPLRARVGGCDVTSSGAGTSFVRGINGGRENDLGETDTYEVLRHELKAAWHRFLDLVQPERPALHRYCRMLTESVWDAEDLVQDALVRAFGTLGKLDYPVSPSRVYLYRIATRTWVAGRGRGVAAERTAPDPPRPRAAAALRDTLGAGPSAIPETLGWSPDAARSEIPSEALVDRFVAAYNAADVDALSDLLLEHGAVEMLGCVFHTGPEARKGDRSWFRGAIGGHPEWPPALRFESQRAERSEFEREPIVLVFRTRGGEEALESVVRLEEEDGRVARVRVYTFCPDTVREIASALGLDVRTGSYRYPTPAPGRSYRDGPPEREPDLASGQDLPS